MWHFYWRSIQRMPSLAVEAVKRVDTFVGILTVCVWVFIGGTAAGAWWQKLPWQVPVAALIVFLIYGFLRAVYEEHWVVEKERDALKDEQETEEQRDALKELLAEAIREGEELLRSDPSIEQAEEWINKIGGVLQIAFLDTSEAQVFYSDEGLPPLYYTDPVLQHVQSPAQKWIRQRLARLTDLIRRADSLRIRPGFNGRDYIVRD